jgi:hypothetical protein
LEEEPNPNLPTPRQAARMRVPEQRHRAERVRRPVRSHGPVNTVAIPWVDFAADLAAILAGKAARQGNRFLVNRREYVLEGGGRLCPVSGDGLIQLGRGAYQALGLYNDLGVSEAAETQLDRAKVRGEERAMARSVWRALQAWQSR